MPHQRYVLEVLGEIDLDTGFLAYQTAGVSLGRQEGKSTLVDGYAIGRSKFRRNQRGVYMCQDRQLARDRVLELAEGPARRTVAKVRSSNGSERLTFTNGSRWSVVAGTAKAGRGRSNDTVVVDEAALLPFSVIDAVGPTQAARPDPQLLVTSNAGDATAEMFWYYTDLGRDAVALDAGTGIAWFEWGPGDDDDRADPETWRGCMPALGFTINERFVAAKLVELARKPEQFDREYLNRWPPGMGGSPGMNLAVWAAARHVERTARRRVLAVDISVDRTWSTIAAAGNTRDGRIVVEVLDRRPGTGWLVDVLRRLRAETRGVSVVADDMVSASVIADLHRARIPVTAIGTSDFTRAYTSCVDGLEVGLISHRGQEVLDDAIAGLQCRSWGDSKAPSRTKSTSDVSPFVACMLAAWELRTNAPHGKPAVQVGASV